MGLKFKDALKAFKLFLEYLQENTKSKKEDDKDILYGEYKAMEYIESIQKIFSNEKISTELKNNLQELYDSLWYGNRDVPLKLSQVISLLESTKLLDWQPSEINLSEKVSVILMRQPHLNGIKENNSLLHPKLDLRDLGDSTNNYLLTISQREWVQELIKSNPNLKKISRKEYSNLKFSIIIDNNGKFYALYSGKKRSEGSSSLSKDTRLGVGITGAVKIAQNIFSGEWVAVKIEESNNDISVNDEINVLERAEILLGRQKVQSKYYLIQKLFHGQTLSKFLKENVISFEERLDISILALTTLKKYHEKGIAHRDVHGKNFLYDKANSTVQLIDFGMAMASSKGDSCFPYQKTDIDQLYVLFRNELNLIDSAPLPVKKCLEKALNLMYAMASFTDAETLAKELISELRSFKESLVSSSHLITKEQITNRIVEVDEALINLQSAFSPIEQETKELLSAFESVRKKLPKQVEQKQLSGPMVQTSMLSFSKGHETKLDTEFAKPKAPTIKKSSIS